MHNVIKLFNKYGIRVKGIKQQGNVKIVNTDKGRYTAKKRNRDDLKDIYNYLEAKNFNYFLSPINENEDDDYEILPFVDNIKTEHADTAIDVINVMAFLHNKTTYYKNISTNEIKEIYEDMLARNEEVANYYHSLQWKIEEERFLLPSRYLLLRNISIIFIAIDKVKYYINKWYSVVKEKNSKRVALVHNNLEIDHFLKNKEMYLINWEDAKVESPIYDLYNFYRKNYEMIDFNSIFNLYNSKYRLQEDEICLLFSLLLQPDKIVFDHYEIKNTKEVYRLTSYLLKVNEFISQYDSATTHDKPD